MASAQRGSYAGARPSGYKDKFSPNNVDGNQNEIADRFGAANADGVTTQRLPYDAYGDQFLVNRLSELPQDKQPFWLINYQAIEAQRGTPGSPLLPTRFGSAGVSNNIGVVPLNNQAFNSNSMGFIQPNALNGLNSHGFMGPSFAGINNPQNLPNRFNPGLPVVQPVNSELTNNFGGINNQQNLPNRFNSGLPVVQPVNPELNTNNFGFGIPQGNRGHFAG